MAPPNTAKRNIAVFAEFPWIRDVGNFIQGSIPQDQRSEYDNIVTSGVIPGDVFKNPNFQNYLIDRAMDSHGFSEEERQASSEDPDYKMYRKELGGVINRSFPSQALAIKGGYVTEKKTFEPGLEKETRGDIKVSVYAYYGEEGVKGMMTQAGADLGGKNIETVVMGHSGATYGGVFPEDWGEYANILMDTANVVDMTLAACNAGHAEACYSAKVLTGFSDSLGGVLATGQRSAADTSDAKWGSTAFKEGKKANWGYEDWMSASASDIFLNPHYEQSGFDVSTEAGRAEWNKAYYDLMREKYDERIAEELGALAGAYPYVTEGLSHVLGMFGGGVGLGGALDLYAESEKHPETGESLYSNIIDKFGMEWFKKTH